MLFLLKFVSILSFLDIGQKGMRCDAMLPADLAARPQARALEPLDPRGTQRLRQRGHGERSRLR